MRGYETCREVEPCLGAGSAPRSERGGRRFKSCHSDQYLADFQLLPGTDCGTDTPGHILLRKPIRLRMQTRPSPLGVINASVGAEVRSSSAKPEEHRS